MKGDGGWSPYVAGALSGLVSAGSVWFVGKFLGASTTFVRTTGMLEQWAAPERVAQMPYFLKELPMIDWQWMMVLGIAIGSFIAAVSSGSFRIQAVPAMWERHVGSSIALRARAAFVGGVIAMFGARLADGCPSGHGLSGSLQLAVSGYVALACFFLGGLLMANWLYRGGGRR